MTRHRFQPLVWPGATLVAGGLCALVAEATTRSDETITLYGLVKVVSDLTLVIGLVWLVIGLGRLLRR